MSLVDSIKILPGLKIGMPRTEQKGFSTFYGVFLPSVLSVFGVIFFLRLGWILGHVGLFQTLLIIVFATTITFITGLSISTAATNMTMKGGGAYYMLSRALGVEVGSSIGVPLFLAQVTGVAFYIEGFAESLHMLLPEVNPHIFEISGLIFIATLSYFSANLALKAQLYIFSMILFALLSIFWGGEALFSQTSTITDSPSIPFWAAFAVFFPAVTGIEAGLSMSGDLKNPRESLPIGTIGAICIGFLVNTGFAVFLWRYAPREMLSHDSMVLQHIAKIGVLVLIGMWGAMISNAIGGMLGAPRTLQALAKDGVVPKFLGMGFGAKNEPRIATGLTFLIALALSLCGGINFIAPILSMFFLASYGMLNFAAGLEALLGNPSWRPTFYVPWTVSMVGAALCTFAMFMIDAGGTFLALFIISCFYLVAKKRNFNRSWDDIRQGVFLFLARFAIYRLANLGPSARSWRPYFLVFSGSPSKRPYLIDFAAAISKWKGFLTVATVVSSDLSDHDKAKRLKESMRDYLSKNKMQALVEINVDDDFLTGMKKIITNYGLGPIQPNTVIIGETLLESHYEKFAELVQHSVKLRKNVVTLRGDIESSQPEKKLSSDATIDIWWDDDSKKNSELMVVLAHMLQSSSHWRQARICIKCLVPNESAREQRMAYFEKFFSNSRLEMDIRVLVVPDEKTPYIKTITHFSSSAALVFLGMRPPKEEEPLNEYTQYYKELLKGGKSLNRVAFVLCSENVEMQKIFN